MKTKIERVTIAHISDVHLSPVRGLWPQYWNLKRILGFANWCGRRAGVHRRSVADELARDMLAQDPDHIVVSGDLTNLGLPAELKAASHWLATLGSASKVTVIPGNHDIYVDKGKDIGVGRWAANMSSNTAGAALIAEHALQSASADSNDEFSAMMRLGGATGSTKVSPAEEETFPFCRVIGPVALIALNSAVPTPPFVAAGMLGDKQRQALARLLEQASNQGLVRIVIIHHPPLPGQAPSRRALRDAEELEKILETYGAELVLHGHNHRDNTTWFKGPINAAPVIGVASGSAAKVYHDEPLARYNIIRIIHWNNKVRIDVTGRGRTEPDQPISDVCLQSFEVRTA